MWGWNVCIENELCFPFKVRAIELLLHRSINLFAMNVVMFCLVILFSCVINRVVFAHEGGSALSLDPFSQPRKIVEFNIKNKTFKIPEDYLSDATKRWGPDSGFDLQVLWPDMEPKNPVNEHKFRIVGGGLKIAISIIVVKSPQLLDGYLERLRGHAASSKNYTSPSEFDQRIQSGEQYGLRVALIDMDKVAKFLSIGKAIEKKKSDLDDSTKGRWDDLYYKNGDDGKLLTLIQCTSVEVPEPDENLLDGITMIRVPYCYHNLVLVDIGVTVSLRYRRVLLENWEGIERKSISLILKFYNN